MSAVIVELSVYRRNGEGCLVGCRYRVRHWFAIAEVDNHLAVGVALVVLRLKFLALGVVLHKVHQHLCAGHSFARRSVEHNYAITIAGQRFDERIDIADAQDAALDGHADVVGREFDEIEARTQAWNLKRVAHGLVSRQSDIAAHVGSWRFGSHDMTAQAGVVLVAVYVVLLGAGYVQSACREAHFAYVVGAQYDHLARHTGQSHLAAKQRMNRGQRQSALGVAQNVHARPGAPLGESVVDVVVLLLGCHVLGVLHELVAGYRHLAAHHEVAVLAGERVERHDVLRLLHACGVAVAVRLLHHLQGC